MFHALVEHLDGLCGRKCILWTVSRSREESAVAVVPVKRDILCAGGPWRLRRGRGRHEKATQRLFIELASCERRGDAAELSRRRTALARSRSARVGLVRGGPWSKGAVARGMDVKNNGVDGVEGSELVLWAQG
jgi:hypothetical protein